jgi:hypothetical protein
MHYVNRDQQVVILFVYLRENEIKKEENFKKKLTSVKLNDIIVYVAAAKMFLKKYFQNS